MLAAELAYLAWLAAEEKTRQKNVVLARDYYDGEQDVRLTERQKEFLGFNADEERFAINYCSTVVDAVVERLEVSGFTSASDQVAGEAWRWWQLNRMDEVAQSVHLGAVRDGEHFVIVDWDQEEGRPRFIPHPRYTDPQVGGTGFGCKAFYPNDNASQPMLCASKRWTETVEEEGTGRRTRQRMTVYYPDRVEKYVLGSSGTYQVGWQPIEDEGDTGWPVAWVDRSGKGLGIPVVHFRNPGLETELWDAIPLQDAVNKTALDILAAADVCGFRILVAKGFMPTTDGAAPESDGGNYISVFPGAWVAIPADAELDPLEGTDLKPMLAALDSWIMKLAQVTDTPPARFQITGQIARAETLKAQEGPLLAKVAARQVRFGNGWEDVLERARRIANTFGSQGLDEAALISTEWAPAETRDEREFIETLGLKVEKLRIPLERIWAEAGYSQEEIAEMKETEEYQARAAMQEMARVGLGAMTGDGETGGQGDKETGGQGDGEMGR